MSVSPQRTACTDMNNNPIFAYQIGTTIKIQAHEPPSSVAAVKKSSLEAKREMYSMTPLEGCLKYPSIAGTTSSEEATLELLEPIRAGDGKSAQLWKVKTERFCSLPLVAKFYDPAFTKEEPIHDPIGNASRNYVRETATYKILSRFQGTQIPKFYGSFICEFKFPLGVHTVHLILIEFIEGISLDSMLPRRKNFRTSNRDSILQRLPTKTRQNILQHIIWVESMICFEGMEHGDLAPRNVMVRCNPDADIRTSLGDPNLQLVLIDFGMSVSNDVCRKWVVINGKPVSPILRWREEQYRHQDFRGWVDWDWDAWIQSVFGECEIFGPITEEYFKYWE